MEARRRQCRKRASLRSRGVKQLAKLCESIISQYFANWIECSRLSRFVPASAVPPRSASASTCPSTPWWSSTSRTGTRSTASMRRRSLNASPRAVRALRLHRYIPRAVAYRRRRPLRRRLLAVRFCDPPSWKNNGRLRNRGVQSSPRIMGSPCSPRCSTSPSFLEGVIILQREECPLMRGYCLVHVFRHEIDEALK